MFDLRNLWDNPNIEQVCSAGCVYVLAHKQDLSVSPMSAMAAHYASLMNVKKRQAVIALQGNAFVLSAGAMQWTLGSVTMTSDVKGVADFLGKAVSAKVTQESAIKPKYSGSGYIMLEPTYKHILLEDVGAWGGLCLDDGLFLACDANLRQQVVMRSNLSSAVFGGKGLFNLMLSGNGIAVLEIPVARDELITIDLNNDEFRVDGNYVLAWSSSLEFSVEKSSRSLLGSAVSGEGLVSVYRGTGRLLVSPVLDSVKTI